MALSKEDREQIREIIQDCVTGINARVESQYTVLNTKVDGINLRLDKVNGNILRHQQEIEQIKTNAAVGRQAEKDYDENRASNCPHLPRIQTLETDKRVKLGIKEFVVGIVGMIAILVGVAFSTIKITEHYNQKVKQEIIETIKTETDKL